MDDPHPYVVFHPDAESDPPRFWTMREAYLAAIEWNRDFPGHRVRRVRPRNGKATLETMLAARGLIGWRVWYRPRHPRGWMVNDRPGDDGMQRLGGNYAEAVDLPRSGALDVLAGIRPMRKA